MMENVKKVINNVEMVIWTVVVFVLFAPVMYVIGMIKVAKKQATLYSGLVQNGHRIGWLQFIKEFSVKQRIQKFETNQGKLAVVHGIPNGLFCVEGQILTHADVAEQLGKGTWNLVSCVNGEHYDYDDGVTKMVRDRNTLTSDPAFCGYLPGGYFIAYSSKAVSVYLYIVIMQFKAAWQIARS